MSKFSKYLRLTLLVIGIALLVFVCIYYRQYIIHALVVVVGAIGYLFRPRTIKDPVSKEDRKIEQNAYQTIDKVKQEATETDKKQQSLDQRADDLEKRVEARRSGPGATMILLALILVVGGTTWAAKDLYIPTDYNELKKLYIQSDKDMTEALDIIKAQKQQIVDLQKQRDEALQAAEDLKKVNLDKDKIIADQAAKIDRLSHQWGVTPGYQTSQGFTLGINRRIDFFSLGVGATSQGSIFGNCTIWF